MEHGWHPPLNFVVIGGGPTGVELAGAISDIASCTCATTSATSIPRKSARPAARWRPARPRRLSGGSVRQSGERRLQAWASKSTPAATSPTSARAGWRPADRIGSGGSMPPSPCGPPACRPRRWASCWACRLDKRGCVMVDDQLNPPGMPKVFVLGDLAHFEQDGKQVPGVAQPAMQMGDHVGQDDRGRSRRTSRGPPSATSTRATWPPSAAWPPSPTSSGRSRRT